jgi:hypothetical protein
MSIHRFQSRPCRSLSPAPRPVPARSTKVNMACCSTRTKGVIDTPRSLSICSKKSKGRNPVMLQAKRPSKGKHRSKAVPVLGLAGVSLAVVGAGASASTGASVADMSFPNTAPPQVVTLGDEEISDVSLATFYVFDKENARTHELGQQFARGGCGRGCGGCRGCRGCRGCGRGCGGCGGCGWCLSTGGCGLC